MVRSSALVVNEMRTTNTFVFSLLLGSIVCACNIPVFRYALERWRPDPCELIVFHRGAISEQDQQRLAAYESKDQALQGVKVITSDLNSPSIDQRELWSQLTDREQLALPHIVVRSQVGRGRTVNAWQGSLEQIERVFDSPVRRELGRRLLAGDSVVWLVIGSTEEKRTAATVKSLEASFRSLANRIELPEGIGLPGSELHSEIPLLLRFSSLVVDRSDDRESFFLSFFSGFHPEAFASGQPLVVPVFGRGRALEVIPADDLTPQLVEDLTVFLSGACSCQVKEQNPGFDLLLSVDWDTELFGEGVEPPPVRTTRDRQKEPVLLTIPPG